LKAQKKYILLSIIAIALIGGVLGFYLYNKGPVDVRGSQALKINAAALYQIFLSDSVQARKLYADKVLEVTGIIKQVSKNQQNQVIVMLQTSEAGAFINCTIEEDKANWVENKTVSLKGICTGMGMGDMDLGILGDVYLIRCYQVH
jgi:UDP-N-acetylmuramyl pentapeptide phosphotransferase/UDP-N-acetylglucosamine-1-phosphate transferase